MKLKHFVEPTRDLFSKGKQGAAGAKRDFISTNGCVTGRKGFAAWKSQDCSAKASGNWLGRAPPTAVGCNTVTRSVWKTSTFPPWDDDRDRSQL